MEAATPRRKIAPRRASALSRRTEQRQVAGLLRRAEAGDIAAIEALLRLRADARRRLRLMASLRLAAIHRAADHHMAARMATAGGTAAGAVPDGDLAASVWGIDVAAELERLLGDPAAVDREDATRGRGGDR